MPVHQMLSKLNSKLKYITKQHMTIQYTPYQYMVEAPRTWYCDTFQRSTHMNDSQRLTEHSTLYKLQTQQHINE